MTKFCLYIYSILAIIDDYTTTFRYNLGTNILRMWDSNKHPFWIRAKLFVASIVAH